MSPIFPGLEPLADWERALLDLADTLPEPDAFDSAVTETLLGLGAVMSRKQRDYGPKAINDSPFGPLGGVLVRIHDKLSRAVHLVESDADPAVVEESLRDTLGDLANYGVIGVMVLDGTWPQ